MAVWRSTQKLAQPKKNNPRILSEIILYMDQAQNMVT